MTKVPIHRRKEIWILIFLWKLKWQEQIQSTGIDIDPPPSKISRISLTPTLVACKNMHRLDLICTWNCQASGYLSMFAGSPFWNGGGSCTDLDSSNRWKALEIDCSQTDFWKKPFSFEVFLMQTFSRDLQFPTPPQIFRLDWHQFPLITAVAGFEKGMKFDIPWQFLKWSDPLLEAPTFSYPT